jgi:hypothetical protein
MHHLTWGSLLAVFGVSGVVAWGLGSLADNAGITPLSVPLTAPLACIVVGAVTLWLAFAVRQYLAGKRPSLDPLRAARTVVLAQASAYTGAMLGGAFLGYGLSIAADWGHEPRREAAIAAGIAAVGALALLVCGWIAERWCRIDPPERDGAATAGGTLAT